MRRLLLGLAAVVLVAAKPELYREKEDFQYSRSSSDDGTKSGYYGAQRGNMGGNYERAHNMDNLAQHQMGGLIKQVQGEVGDGSRTKSGNVFTSANSQGIYGSGRYDLSNLGDRNFQDRATYDNSQSQSSANRAYESHSLNENNARYSTNSQSHNSGLRGYQSSNLQEAQNLYGAGEYEHGSQSRHSSNSYTQSGYQGINDYEHSNINQQASNGFGEDRQNQIRILVRPGSRVIVPISTQATKGSRTASYYDQNTANSEAELLNSADQQVAFKPSTNAKHYESAYSYRKQWEKHDVKPEVVPLAALPVYQIPANSELYDASQSHHGSQYENSNYNLASSQVRHRSDMNTQHQTSSSSQLRNHADYSNQQQSALSSSDSNVFTGSGYNSDTNSAAGNLIGSLSSKPKSYQSSYSYHKSWERQGDPYVIKPVSQGTYNAETSQRLSDQSQYSAQNYGSRQTKSRQAYSASDCVIECDPNSHIRVARSAGDFDKQSENTYTGQETQQSETGWQNFDFGQQAENKWDKLEDLGQHSQNKWNNLEEVGQQTQNKWDKLEDLGQQTQNGWENLQELGQQTQDFSQQTQDFGQQTQEFGQQSQNKLDNLEDFGQQTQDFGQQFQDFGQQTQNSWNNFEGFEQQSQSLDEQKVADWDKPETQQEEILNFGQQSQDKWDQLGGQGTENQDSYEGMQQTQTSKNNTISLWDKMNDQEQTQKGEDYNLEQQSFEPLVQYPLQTEDLTTQKTQGIPNLQEFGNVDTFNKSGPSKPDPFNDEKPLNSLWDKIDNLDGDYIAPINKNDMNFDNSYLSQNSTSYYKNGQKDSAEFSQSITSPESNDQQHNFNDFDTLGSTSNKSSTSTEKKINAFQVYSMPDKGLHKQERTTENSFILSHIAKNASVSVENHSKDKGRGDIGPEDTFDMLTSTTEKLRSQVNITGENKNQSKYTFNTNEGFIITHTESTPDERKSHDVKIEKSPEDVEQQFVTHPQQQIEIIVNHQEDRNIQQQNTNFVQFEQNSNDWDWYHQSQNEKEFKTESNKQDLLHYEDGNFNKHSTQFIDIGQQSQDKPTQYENNQFYHHVQTLNNPNQYNFHKSGNELTPNTEQQITQSFGTSQGWELHQAHKFQHEHSSEYSHQHGFHHQESLHHQHNFQEHESFYHGNTNLEGMTNSEQHQNHHNKHHQTYYNDKDSEQQHHHWQSFESKPDFETHQSVDSLKNNEHHDDLLQKWNFEQEKNKYQFPVDFYQNNKESQLQDQFGNSEEKNTADFKQNVQDNTFFHQQNVEHTNFDKDQMPVVFSQITEQNGDFDKFEQKNEENFEQQENKSEFNVMPIELNQESQVLKTENFESFGSLRSNEGSPNEGQFRYSNPDTQKETFTDTQNHIIEFEQQTQKHDQLLSPAKPDEGHKVSLSPEPTTEKPGFWKSIGSKISNAKNKVASWFG